MLSSPLLPVLLLFVVFVFVFVFVLFRLWLGDDGTTVYTIPFLAWLWRLFCLVRAIVDIDCW